MGPFRRTILDEVRVSVRRLAADANQSSRQVVFVLEPRHTGVQDLPTQTGAVDFVFTVAFPPTGVVVVAVSVKPAGPNARADEALAFELRLPLEPLVGKGSNGSKFPLDVVRFDVFAAIEPFDEFVQLGLAGSLGEFTEEAVEKWFAGEGVSDLALLVVFVEFGEVNDAELTTVVGFAVDLEHDFVGCAHASSPFECTADSRSSNGPL